MRKTLSALVLAIVFMLAVSAEADELEYVNSFNWSNITDISVQGNYAYCAAMSGMIVFDISDLESPELISKLCFSKFNRSIYIHGDYAYIFGTDSTLKIIDVANPEIPFTITELNIPSIVDNLVIDGDLLFLATGVNGLIVYNIEDINNPDFVSQYYTIGHARGIFICDSLAYIAAFNHYPNSSGLEILNIADPADPLPLGIQADSIYMAWDVLVDGDYAYIADISFGLNIWNISDPSDPTYVSGMDIYGSANHVSKFGDYVFLNYDADTLQIFNVSDPYNPVLLENFSTGKTITAFNMVDNFIFIAEGSDGFSSYEFTSGQVMLQRGFYTAPPSSHKLFSVENYLFAFEGEASVNSFYKFDIYDISNPSDPMYINSIYLSDTLSSYGIFNGNLYLTGVQSSIRSRLNIFDLSNPAIPQLLLNWRFFDIGISSFCVDEQYVYLGNCTGGVNIYEQVAPDSLVYINNYDDQYFNGTQDLDIVDDILYLANTENIMMFDISDPADSVFLGEFGHHFNMQKIFPYQQYLFTNNGDIIDISNPPNLSIVDSLDIYVEDIAFANSIAFMACGVQGVYAYDISELPEVELIAHFETPGISTAISIYNDYIYVSDETSILVLRLTTTGLEQVTQLPSAVSLAQNYSNPFNAQTTINFSLPRQSEVTLDIYDILGRKISTLYNDIKPAGKHSVIWNADDFASGMYFYKLTAGDFEQSERMILLK